MLRVRISAIKLSSSAAAIWLSLPNLSFLSRFLIWKAAWCAEDLICDYVIMQPKLHKNSLKLTIAHIEINNLL
jgi:hypothetical protein